MRPIETEYHGYRFRSRLEARWAVFFDALGVEWRYEPEGYEQDDSTNRYLPDFCVKCWGYRGNCPREGYGLCAKCVHSYRFEYCSHDHCNDAKRLVFHKDGGGIVTHCDSFEAAQPFDLYVEVKGHMTQHDADRIYAFYDNGKNPILIVGDIPNVHQWKDYAVDSAATKSYEPMDGIGIYPFNYQTIDGDHFAAYPAAHDGRFYLMGDDSSYIDEWDIPAIQEAYDRARKARFEFGETPR